MISGGSPFRAYQATAMGGPKPNSDLKTATAYIENLGQPSPARLHQAVKLAVFDGYGNFKTTIVEEKEFNLNPNRPEFFTLISAHRTR